MVLMLANFRSHQQESRISIPAFRARTLQKQNWGNVEVKKQHRMTAFAPSKHEEQEEGALTLRLQGGEMEPEPEKTKE